MTAQSTPHLANPGEVEMPMQTAWNRAIAADQFAAGCSWIMANTQGERQHIAFDLWSNLTLASLGYSEGVEIFHRGVAGWHQARAAAECDA